MSDEKKPNRVEAWIENHRHHDTVPQDHDAREEELALEADLPPEELSVEEDDAEEAERS